MCVCVLIDIITCRESCVRGHVIKIAFRFLSINNVINYLIHNTLYPIRPPVRPYSDKSMHTGSYETAVHRYV